MRSPQTAGRPYAGREDLERACQLLDACLAADAAQGDLTVSQLREVLPSPRADAVHNARLWEGAAGAVLGFGWAWTWTPPGVAPRPANLVALAHPDLDTETWTSLVQEIVAWGIGRAHEIARTEGVPVTLRALVDDRQRRLIAGFREAGLTLEERHHLHYARRLDDPAAPIPSPALPDGFTIRPLRGADEVEAFVALWGEAMGVPAPLTAPEQLATMGGPDYSPDLELLAEAPDGELAAYVTAGIDRDECARRGAVVGFTDPLGTRPRHRRLGLARGLLYEAFRRLRAHGAVETRVETGSWNTATQRLLESVGYRVTHRLLVFGQQVPPAPPG
jgi:ribosomal protein S18 acetylase RimI-like enzyme